MRQTRDLTFSCDRCGLRLFFPEGDKWPDSPCDTNNLIFLGNRPYFLWNSKWPYFVVKQASDLTLWRYRHATFFVVKQTSGLILWRYRHATLFCCETDKWPYFVAIQACGLICCETASDLILWRYKHAALFCSERGEWPYFMVIQACDFILLWNR